MKILIESGYDSFAILESINQEQILIIEEYINGIKGDESNILKGSVYDGCDHFKFRPGHSALLLRLPKIIEEIKSKKKAKNPVNVLNCVADDLLAEKELTEKSNLKKRLMTKILEFIKKNELQINFNEKHISEFFTENNQIKCLVECGFCDKKYTCSFGKYWLVGNFERHLKEHKKNVEDDRSNDPTIDCYEYYADDKGNPIGTPKIIRIQNELRNKEMFR